MPITEVDGEEPHRERQLCFVVPLTAGQEACARGTISRSSRESQAQKRGHARPTLGRGRSDSLSQKHADLGEKIADTERLTEKIDALLLENAVNDHVIRITGHDEDFNVRPLD